MHSRSVQEGHSVPFRSEWNCSTCTSSVRVKSGEACRAFSTPAAKGLCLWKQLFCVPRYSGTELEEKALPLKLIWFTDLMVGLNIWKSAGYSTELNFELDISLTDLVRFWRFFFFSWYRFLTDMVDCKWQFDLNTRKLDIWEPILCITGEVLFLLRLYSVEFFA